MDRIEEESPLRSIDKRYQSLSKTERRVADYVRLHPDKTIISSLQLVSGKCSVSDTSDIAKTLDRYTKSDIDTAASKICQARHVLIAGLAGSAGVARIFNDCLLGLGLRSTYISDRVELERFVSGLDNHDLVFGISHSGETREIVHAIRRGRERLKKGGGLRSKSRNVGGNRCPNQRSPMCRMFGTAI